MADKIRCPKIGIGILLFNKDQKILLGKRKNSHGASTWAPPGGHLEFGESFEDCAIRETQEETGLCITDPIFCGITNSFFEEEQQHYVSIFMKASVQKNQNIQNKEPHKNEGWCWFSLDDFPDNLFLSLHQFLSGNGYGQDLISLK